MPTPLRVSPYSARSLRVAFVVSAAAHGLLVAFACFRPWTGGPAKAGPAVIDTRVPAGGREFEVTVTLADPPRRRLPKGLTPPAPRGAEIAQARRPAPPPTIPAWTGRDQRSSATTKPVTNRSATDRGVHAAAAGGPREAGAPGQTTSFFQIGTAARTIVFVIDRSASMGLNGGLAAARRELLVSLARLRADCRFQVILYNRFAEPLRVGGHDGLLAATEENKRQVAQAVQSAVAEGGTEHLLALRRALAFRPDVIYVLSDAADLRPDQVRALTSLNQGRTCIHAVELTDTSHPGGTALSTLARCNRGAYRAVAVGGFAYRRGGE